MRLHPGWSRGWRGGGEGRKVWEPRVCGSGCRSAVGAERWKVTGRLRGGGAGAGRACVWRARWRPGRPRGTAAAAPLSPPAGPPRSRGASPEPRRQRAVGKRGCGGRAGAAVGCVSPRPALLVVTRRALCAPARSAPGAPGAGAGLGAGGPPGLAAGGPAGGCAWPRGEVGSLCLRRGGPFVLEINGQPLPRPS